MSPFFLRRHALPTASGTDVPVAADVPTHDRLTHAQVLLSWGRRREAAAVLLQPAADVSPQQRGAYGQALLAAGCVVESEAPLLAAAHSGDARSLAALVTCLRKQGRYAEALAHCASVPMPNAELRVLHGECLNALERCGEAEAVFREALARDASDALAWHGLARALRALGRLEEALVAWREVQRLDDPRTPFEATLDLALVLQATGRLPDAIETLRAALRRYPSIDGHRTLAQLLLAGGRLREAWDLYEFRWMLEPLLSTRGRMKSQAWSGQDLAGKTILIRVEQGFGDVIQFMRYARWLRDLGARVVVGPFSDIAGSFVGVDHVLAPGEDHRACDYHVNVMSLPLLFGTTLETVPADVPYLALDAAKAAAWRIRLGGRARLRVGLVWAGGAGHPADRARSLHLRDFLPLLEVPEVELIALQKGLPAGQVRDLGLAERVRPVGDDLADFSDTAAAIAALDLVISVDTSVAHLAGALGKPVWVLVTEPADWRWLSGRDDSPWYPTLRLFRQARPGSWGEVVARVRDALAEHVHGPTPARVKATSTGPAPHARDTEEWLAAHPAELAAVTETAYGILQYLPADRPGGASLAWYGEYLREQLDLFLDLVESGTTVLEIGAAIGEHALALARRVQEGGHVLAVEMDAKRRQILAQNVAVNRCGNVTVVTPPGGSDIAMLVDALALSRLEWLKVGPDESARRVLAGAQRTLWELRPGVFASLDDHGDAVALAHIVRDYGYRCWLVESALFRASNFAGVARDVFTGATCFALLALPEERAGHFSHHDALEIE